MKPNRKVKGRHRIRNTCLMLSSPILKKHNKKKTNKKSSNQSSQLSHTHIAPHNWCEFPGIHSSLLFTLFVSVPIDFVCVSVVVTQHTVPGSLCPNWIHSFHFIFLLNVLILFIFVIFYVQLCIVFINIFVKLCSTLGKFSH